MVLSPTKLNLSLFFGSLILNEKLPLISVWVELTIRLLASISTTFAIMTGPIASVTVPDTIWPACCAKAVEDRKRIRTKTPFCPAGFFPHKGARNWRRTDHPLIYLNSIFIINYSLFHYQFSIGNLRLPPPSLLRRKGRG